MADVQHEEKVADKATNTLPTEEQLAERAREFQKTFRGYLFPLLRVEAKRFWLMAAIFFIIAFIYTFLRIYKDNVINSVLEPAAQNWLKLATFLVSFLMVGFIQKLLVNNTMDKVFDIATMFFAFSLACNAGLIYFRDSGYLQKPLGWAQEMFNSNNVAVRGIGVYYVPVLIFNHWILSLFYVLCEVISSIMVSYLFMTYTNSHCTADQNKRFVRLLYIFSNVSGFAASKLFFAWNNIYKKRNIVEREKFYVIFIIAAVALFMVIIGLKRVLDVVFETKIVEPSSKPKKTTKSKKSVSYSDGIYYAVSSKLLLSMSIMTLMYNISANLLGSNMFTNALAAAASSKGLDRSTFSSDFKADEMMYTTIIVVIVMFSPMSKLYERFGVLSMAGVPLVISIVGVTAVCYYAAVNFASSGEENMAIARSFEEIPRDHDKEVWVNLIVAAAIKISKYAFFDIIKEALSMKINPEIRPLFKGVYDGVCGKLGKCLSAGYGLAMSAITGQRDSRYYAPVSFVMILLFGMLWGWAIYYLHKSYKKAVENGTYMSPDFIEGFRLKDE